MEKYFVYLDNNTVFGLKYSTRLNRLTVGGNARFISSMEAMLIEYFDLSIDRVHSSIYWVQKNKIRFDIEKYPRDRFVVSMQKIKEHGIHISQTEKHGNIMR